MEIWRPPGAMPMDGVCACCVWRGVRGPATRKLGGYLMWPLETEDYWRAVGLCEDCIELQFTDGLRSMATFGFMWTDVFGIRQA